MRLAPLGRYVTPDEPAWVYRSVRFADALAARDWPAVPSTGHPGVTTMWLGAAGVAVRRLLDPAGSAAHLDWIRSLIWLAPENSEAFRHLAFFLPFGRIAIALVTSLALLAVYALTARLFDRRAALVAVGLLAFDPFLVGHSGLLHTDALLTTFTLLALLAALNGLRGPRPALWWSLSGLLTGLALLTKTPALLLIPFVLLLSFAHHLQSATRNPPFAIRLFRPLTHCSLFITSLFITFFALYPALWADPLGVTRTLGDFASHHVETLFRPVFFLGRMTHDPGPAFYPLVFLFRISPVVLVGLVVGLFRLRRMPADRRFAFLIFLAFAVLFGAAMSLGAKMHDRYLLPAFPPLALAAALSLSEVLHPRPYARSPQSPCPPVSLSPRPPVSLSPRPPVSLSPCPLVSLSPCLLPIVLQLTLLLPFATYPLTYSNLLLGGPPVAARVLSVDWGEGMGAAARWLNRLPDADQLTVAAINVPSFAALFAGRTVPLDQSPLADYFALGSSRSHTPTHPTAYTATLGLLDHAVILTNTAPFEQAAYLAGHAGANELILLDADTPLLRRYEEPEMILSAASLPDEAAVAAWLAEIVPGHRALWLVSLPGASPITAAHLRRQVEAIAGPVSTAAIASATVTEFVPHPSPVASSPSPCRAVFGGQLVLVDGVAPTAISWPNPLRVVLRWRSLGVPPADYRAVVTLRCPEPVEGWDGAGHAWSIADRPVLNEVDFPTSAWAADDWVDRTYTLSLLPGIPPGDYTIEVSLYDAATGAGLGAAGPDGTFRGTQVLLGEVSVVPPAAPPDPAALEITRRLDVPAGPLTLLGLEPPPAQVPSGDHLPCALFWQADAAPEADYRVRLRLVGSAGEVRLEEFFPLSPYPTSRWRAGDRFESRHDLHVLPDLPPGDYELALNVLDAEDDPLWAADRTLATVEVLPRERSFELPGDIPYPLDLAFGEIVHLRGCGLARTDAAPGGTLALTLYWQAEGPADRDYTLFVHLLGADGLPYGQVDRTPGGGLAPTTSWAAGQVIVDEVILPVAADAPPGTYHVAIGFYDAAHGDRLPVSDATGQPLPGNQAVLPLEINIAGGQP